MSDIEFGKTSDGFHAARIGDASFAMLPIRDGFRIAAAYSDSSKPLSETSENNYLGYIKRIQTVEEFKEEMQDMANHLEQAAALGRFRFSSSASTPWGKSQGGTCFVDKGIYKHSTAGHGGFKVYAKLNREIPEAFRNEDGWYEEDSEYAKVVVSLPAYFTDREIREATKAVKNSYPDEYEAVTGEILQEGESRAKDERLFHERHADDWLVVSASREDDEHVRCSAVKGGYPALERNRDAERAEFKVPVKEYGTRTFAFVIDPERHPRLDEENSPSPSM